MIVMPKPVQKSNNWVRTAAEVSIANLDIGFANAGQVAEVKLENFSYI